MKIRKSLLVHAPLVALLALPSAIGVQVAAESDALASCPVEYGYGVSAKRYRIRASGQYFKDGPGGTMQVSVNKSSTISASGTVSGGASFNGILFAAQAKVDASITKSTTVTIGHTYTHSISAGKYGNMDYGSWGYTLSWVYTRTNPNCTSTTLSSGTMKAPVKAVGWYYWETSS